MEAGVESGRSRGGVGEESSTTLPDGSPQPWGVRGREGWRRCGTAPFLPLDDPPLNVGQPAEHRGRRRVWCPTTPGQSPRADVAYNFGGQG